MQNSSISKTKSAFITGTLVLTIAGVLTRVIGFFYKIFLSRTIGAEGLGIYQLISPVAALGFAVTMAGIQTSISKFVSDEVGKQSILSRNGAASQTPASAVAYLSIGTAISLLLSAAVGFLLYRYAEFLSVSWLGDARCTPLLKVLAFSFAPCCIHACINGYYYGIKKTGVPSLCQLTEQLARVGSIYLFYQICLSEGKPFSLTFIIWGMVIGEAASTLVSLTCFSFRRPAPGLRSTLTRNLVPYTRNLLSMAIPLTANRVVLTLFSGFENIMIPNRLRMFGYTNSEALGVYGILTGMAMSVIMFPSVITNSVSVLLLPTISEAQASGDIRLIHRTIRKTVESCLILGFLCTAAFLFTGKYLGNTLFGNALAGTFIVTLGWICPFLYLGSTLTSILHGLGYPGITFLLNLLSCGIRILFVMFAVPVYGIKSYLAAMLVSQIVIALLAIAILYKKAPAE